MMDDYSNFLLNQKDRHSGEQRFLNFFFFFFFGAAPTDCTQDLTPGQQLSNGESSTRVQLAT